MNINFSNPLYLQVAFALSARNAAVPGDLPLLMRHPGNKNLFSVFLVRRTLSSCFTTIEVYVKFDGFAHFCNGNPLISWTVIRRIAFLFVELVFFFSFGRSTLAVALVTNECVKF